MEGSQRIILFSDVHGNITGLRAVLDQATRLENVTHIIGLGDYFGYGAGCNDIIELCQEKNVLLVRGGHEEILNIIDAGQDGGRYMKEIYFTHQWLKKNLKNKYYEMVTSLPFEVRLKLNEKYDLIGFHATYRDMEANVCGTDRPLETLETAYGKLDENVVVYGHYHEPHVIPFRDKLLINCASVGMRKNDSMSNYTVIEYDREKIAIIQRQVEFDKAEEDRLVEERGMLRRM